MIYQRPIGSCHRNLRNNWILISQRATSWRITCQKNLAVKKRTAFCCKINSSNLDWRWMTKHTKNWPVSAKYEPFSATIRWTILSNKNKIIQRLIKQLNWGVFKPNFQSFKCLLAKNNYSVFKLGSLVAFIHVSTWPYSSNSPSTFTGALGRVKLRK